MMPRSYALGERFERFIEEKVRSGRFGIASEVVRAGLRLLEDQERRRELELEKLRQAIDDGRRSGPPRSADEVFDLLEARYREMASPES
jgi:antitoxin ParD1/3/4